MENNFSFPQKASFRSGFAWFRPRDPANKIVVGEISCSGAFLFLCLLHFFSQRPLWLDEVSILKNIQELNYQQLFGPLNYAQAFPRVYLVVIKLVSGFFNYHVLALRIFPLISMLLGYAIWRKIYKEVFGSTGFFLLALFSMTGGYYFSYYAGEFKPYAMDVLVVGIFSWFLMRQKAWVEENRFARCYAVAVGLPFTLFFSYAAFLVFWMVGYNFLFLLRKRKDVRPLLAIYSTLSLLCLAFIYNFDLKHSWADQALMHYWDPYFICTQSGKCFGETVWEGVRRLSTSWFGKGKIFMQFASFLIPFFLYSIVRYGFGSWIKERGKIFSIASIYGILFLELFVLGCLHKFPFTGERITLFFAPFVFYGLIKGLYDLKQMRWMYYVFGISYLVLVGGSYGDSWVRYWALYK